MHAHYSDSYIASYIGCHPAVHVASSFMCGGLLNRSDRPYVNFVMTIASAMQDVII